MTKTIWTKTIPTKEGWYWIKFRCNKGIVKRPCEIFWFEGGGVVVNAAYNTTFTAGPNHGGPALRHDGKIDKSIRFGPEIPIP